MSEQAAHERHGTAQPRNPSDAGASVSGPGPRRAPATALETVPVAVDGVPDHDAEFTAFVTHATPVLARTAWLLCGSSAQAEELVQQALVRTYLAWPRAREREPLAYARRVLANARIDTWRKHRREVLTAPRDLPEEPVAAEADRQAERDLLVRALASLSSRQRRIVVLRHLVGLSEAEVAEDLSVSVGTVKSTASRGLRTLRDTLDQLEGREHPRPDRPGAEGGEQ